MPIVKEERYFGEGLPPEGTTDAKAAYTLGLKRARERAVCTLINTATGFESYRWHYTHIVEHWPDLERVIAEADEKFDAECSTELLAAVRIKPYLDQKRAEALADPDFAEVEEPPPPTPCANPDGHKWVHGDRHDAKGSMYCEHCGADGEA